MMQLSPKLVLSIFIVVTMLLSAWFYIGKTDTEIQRLTTAKQQLEVRLANANLNSAKLEHSLDVQNAQINLLKVSKERADKEFSAELKEVEQDRKALLALVNTKPTVVTQYITQECNNAQVNDANEALSILLDGVK